MDIKLAQRDFWAQRASAKGRGIGWSFSFKQWVEWWASQLGPQWQEFRGCRRGQYVMARKGDKGPYHPSNVNCLLATRNSSDKRDNGSSNPGELHGMAKLTERQAIAIRTARGTLHDLSKKFGVHYDTVRYIKNGELWSYLADTVPSVPFTPKKVTHSRLKREQVIAIFASNEPARILAKRYGVTADNIHCIRGGRSWASITQNLPRK